MTVFESERKFANWPKGQVRSSGIVSRWAQRRRSSAPYSILLNDLRFDGIAQSARQGIVEVIR
jgi:hypothetical protein